MLRRDFRSIRPEDATVLLLEAGPRILPAFHEELSRKAVEQLSELGVAVHVRERVVAIDERGVTLGLAPESGPGEREAGCAPPRSIEAATVVWAAGVEVAPIVRSLGVPLDPQGRVLVGRDLSIPGHPEAFAIGDLSRFDQAGKPLPGVSQVAMQGGAFAANAIRATLAGRTRSRFHYFDKGIMATVGRSRAVAELRSG